MRRRIVDDVMPKSAVVWRDVRVLCLNEAAGERHGSSASGSGSSCCWLSPPSCLATDEARPGQCLAERHDCFVVCYSPGLV